MVEYVVRATAAAGGGGGGGSGGEGGGGGGGGGGLQPPRGATHEARGACSPIVLLGLTNGETYTAQVGRTCVWMDTHVFETPSI